MAINIQKIIDQITTKAAAADSSMGTQYLLSLSKATLAMNNATGVIEYKAKSELPTVDSSLLGNFAYIAARADLDSVYGDSYAGFYYAARIGSNDSGWDRIRTGADSDAEASGGGVSGTQAQGSISGYATGGWPGTLNNIEKFSFTSDGNGTDVGDMTVARNIACGQSSTVSGYTSAGNPSPPIGNVIDKFPFAVDANATDVGNLTQQRYGPGGQSSTTHGYTSGGYATVPVSSPSNVIDKFPFSTDANATDVGDLTVARQRNTGQSSADNGYTSGGQATPSYYNIIDKFPFASDANATDVGDLIRADWAGYGQNSSTDGYFSGGIFSNTTNESADIQKFPFASDANATDVGDLTLGRYHGQGQSSTASGYSTGGQTTPPQAASNIIDKFPFASDGNATDVGDLTSARGFIAGGQQV